MRCACRAFPWEYGAWVTFGEASEDARSGASPAPHHLGLESREQLDLAASAQDRMDLEAAPIGLAVFPGSSAGHPDASARRAGRARSGARQRGSSGAPADASARCRSAPSDCSRPMAAKASLACTIVGPGASRSGLVRTSGVCGQRGVSGNEFDDRHAHQCSRRQLNEDLIRKLYRNSAKINHVSL